MDRRAEKEISDDLVYTQDRIAKTTRTIERSLRTIVRVNKEKIKVTMTDEEKTLDLLAQQQ